MEPMELPLYISVEKPFTKNYRVYACTYFAAIVSLVYYRIAYMPTEAYWPWILAFGAELGFAYVWILEQAFRWWPVERKVFPENLSQRYLAHLFSTIHYDCTRYFHGFLKSNDYR